LTAWKKRAVSRKKSRIERAGAQSNQRPGENRPVLNFSSTFLLITAMPGVKTEESSRDSNQAPAKTDRGIERGMNMVTREDIIVAEKLVKKIRKDRSIMQYRRANSWGKEDLVAKFATDKDMEIGISWLVYLVDKVLG